MRLPKICTALLFALEFFNIIQSSLSHWAPHDFVDAHNAVRLAEGLPPLYWHETVAEYARNYANVRSADCLMQHSVNGPYGESIYEGGAEDTAQMVVDDWVGEKKFWNPSTKTCKSGEDCGHYLQVIDPLAFQLGCARVKCTNDDYYWFVNCNYNGPGWKGPGWDDPVSTHPEPTCEAK